MISKKLNELATKNLKNKFNDHLGPVKCLHYDEPNKLMFSGSEEGVIKVWKTDVEENLICKRTFPVPNGSSASVIQYSHALKLLFTGGEDGNVVVWQEGKDLDFKPALVIKCGLKINSLLVTNQPDLLFVGTERGTMKVYEFEYNGKGGLIYYKMA